MILLLVVTDSLVLHFQLIHDGHLPGWFGLDDPPPYSQQRLRQISQGN